MIGAWCGCRRRVRLYLTNTEKYELIRVSIRFEY